MQFSVTFDGDASNSRERSGPVSVGWLLTEPEAGIVFEPPTRVRSADMSREHAKSASRCPAVINLESRYFQVNCPFDLHLEFIRDENGIPAVRDLNGNKGPIRPKKIRKHLHIVDEVEWRYPDRPTLQLQLPYIFIADEPVYLSQIAPFMHYQKRPWPGTIFGGRFPINVWPRPLMWAFEWHDIALPLILKRGDPLFYAHFETLPQDRSVQLVEAERTEELSEYLDLISGAVNYVNQTFTLFKSAEERRPSQLLTPRKRN